MRTQNRDTFKQTRKEEANIVDAAIYSILKSYFNVSDKGIVNAEETISGRYDTSSQCVIQKLDFAGIDWIIDQQPKFHAIAQRIRPKSSIGDFSIRVQNGSETPCEYDVLKESHLRPNYFIYALRDNITITDAWLLNADETFEYMSKSNNETEMNENGDNTAAIYAGIEDLKENGCVEAEFPPVTAVPHDDILSPDQLHRVVTGEKSVEKARKLIANRKQQ